MNETKEGRYEQLRRRVFDILQIGNKTDPVSRAFDFFLALIIIINITAMFLETFDELAPYYRIIEAVELVTVLVFVVEYVLRIWTADFLFPGISRGRAVLRFLLSFDGIVDLLTILPFFYLSGFVAFRMLRVVRIFHLFRINAYYDSFNVIRAVFREKWNQIASSVFIIVVLILAASLSMYGAEHDAQPEHFKNAFSGVWWSVSALLTVGYGDIYPVTALGKAMAILISFLGVGAVAIPTGIISAGFVEQYTKATGSGRRGSSAMASGNIDITALLQTVFVDIDSGWIGKDVRSVEQSDDALIVLVKRRGKTERPDRDYRVMVGDELAVLLKE